MTPVILYTQPGRSPCTTAKEFLSSQKVRFEEKDIRQDPEALRELVEELQSSATPTLVVGGPGNCRV